MALDPANVHGWTAYRMELPDGPTMRLKLVHTRTVQVAGLAFLLFLASLLWWIARDRP